MSPLINILIRTAKRPAEFRKCIQSVQEQSYKNVRLIVCTDDLDSLPYVQEELYYSRLKYELFTVASSGVPFHWNFYCNNLKSKVTAGWFFYLDDDDTIADSSRLEEAVTLGLVDTNAGYIFQFLRGSTRKPALDFNPSEIRRGKIGGSCIFLNHAHKEIAHWDGRKAADYRFIKAVAQKLPLKFVPIVVVKAGNNGRHGK